MSDHSVCLQSVCRLCGSGRAIIKGRQPLRKQNFSKVIQAALSINIYDDIMNVHPPHICQCCELKLMRWKKRAQKKLKGSCKCNIDIVSFEEHECPSCIIKYSEPTLRSYEEAGKKMGLLSWCTGDRVHIIRMTNTGSISVSLVINVDFTWKLIVVGVDQCDNHMFREYKPTLTIEATEQLCGLLATANFCIANNDFEDLVISKKGPQGQIPINISSNDTYDNIYKTIRHNKCTMFLSQEVDRCRVCSLHRSDLAAMRSAMKNKVNKQWTLSSTTPNQSLSRVQLTNKACGLQTDRRCLKRKNTYLEEKITKMYRKESEVLTHHQSACLEETFNKFDDTDLPLGSAARLLWEQQKLSLKKGKQMRWHPAVIRWCIALQNRSASSYNLLRESGFLKLPHPRTLHHYSHFADNRSGFSPEMLERVVTDIGLHKEGGEMKKDVSLLFDEMKVKSGLCFSVKSGQIAGFTDVGTLANEVNAFERRCKGQKEPPVATHVLVLMVRGIFGKLHSPVGYYPSKGATSDELFSCIWEAIEYIEVAGFRVRALISDGASPNRKFYRLHSVPGSTTLTYCTHNEMDPSRNVYFICDVPHLMKTTRNNWENSHYNNKTRHLHYNKQDIKWTQLLDLYEWDTGLERLSPGLRRLHKISYEHLHLTPSLRMRVYMAAQVLSSTMANALESHGRYDTTSTVKFIRMFDQFFDCLNVSSLYQGINKIKPALKPYRSTDDWRFKWLKDEFIGFLDEWEAQVDSLENVSNAAKKKMMLSRETQEGLRITVNSFVELGVELLSRPDVDFLLSEKFNQDPLEQYFSKQRGAGGSSDNPTVAQFGHNMQALYVASECAKASKRGNCRNIDLSSSMLDDTPLPRRK